MKDYYEILGVHKGATSGEIKRAFRKLAIQYHPDKNPDAGAEQIFKEINEAYEVLGDPASKTSYDLIVAGYREPVTVAERPHRDPAYRRTRPPVNRKSERQRLYEAMLPWVPLAHRVAYFAFVVSVFLAIDYMLPFRHSFETIVHTDVKTYKRSVTEWLIVVTDQGKSLELPISAARYFQMGDDIVIESSRLLGLPVFIEGHNGRVRLLKSIYGSFAFVPIALLISSGYGIYHRNRADYSFSAGLVSFLILVITAIIYLLIA